MPELPEVETIVNELCSSQLVGAKILEAKVFWPRTIDTLSIQEFCNQLHNQIILKISRRGKFIVFTLSHYTLLIHLRMTGKFILTNMDQNSSSLELSHERVQLTFSNGCILHYADQRKFGKWYLLKDPEPILGQLGLEPLSIDFTFQAFQKIISNKNAQIKPFLLNQHYIAGLGNIYVDEALWEAKISPTRGISTLTSTEVKSLYKAIPHVLKKGIAYMGTSLGSQQANYFSVSGRRGYHQTQLRVFRRDGLLCPRCQTKIIKITLAQRGTHLCPFCQK